MKKEMILFSFYILFANLVQAQSAPVVQNLPYVQHFGIVSFNVIPVGTAVWNGVNGTSVNSQTLAELSTPTGNASIGARTTPTTTGGAYGYATASNGRIYIQSSSNSIEGLNQLAVGFNTGSANRVKISYDMEVVEAGTGRSMGSVLQIRQGNSGSWTTVAGSARIYNQASTNGTDADQNGDVDSYSYEIDGLFADTDYQLRWAHWRSGSAGNSVGLAYDNIHVVQLPGIYNLTGGGVYCAGGNGLPVQLEASQQGVLYQLLLNGIGTGSPVEGNGVELDFGTRQEEGTYTVLANFPGGNAVAMSGEVLVQVQQPPSTADAGQDQVVCQQPSITLQASTPLTGIGHWTQLSGPEVNFEDMLSPSTIVTNLAPGQYSFRWTVEYGVCPASVSDVAINNLPAPSVSFAGSDRKECSVNFTLQANEPSAGSGIWTKASGPGEAVFTNEHDHQAGVNVSAPGKYIFRWTISNGECTPSSADVEIEVNEAPVISGNLFYQQSKLYGSAIDPISLHVSDDGEGHALNATASFIYNNGLLQQGLPGNLALEIFQTGTNDREWKLSTGAGSAFPAAGIYLIKILVSDDCHAATEAVVQLNITPANVQPLADAFYTGACFFWSNANSRTASLTLAATIKNAQGYTGDIRTAKVSFFNREGGQLIPLQGAQDLSVGLLNSSDLSTGSASATVQYHLGSADVSVLNIAVVVTGNYSVNDPATDKTITLAVPVPGGQICGGVNLINSASQGLIAGAQGWQTNAGFFVQYNSSLKNQQGRAEVKILSYHDRNGNAGNVLRTYVARSNSITQFSISGSTAQFSAKASLVEIVNGVEYPVEGNCILQLDMTDGGSGTDAGDDQLAITLYRSKGGTWFSSNWNGTASQLQSIFNGNLSVSNAGASNKHHVKSNKLLNELTGTINVYPNPSETDFTIQLPPSFSDAPVQLTIIDQAGRVVQSSVIQGRKELKLGSRFKKGIYILQVAQGFEVIRATIVKQ